MQFDIISLFPEMFDGPLGHSILKRAREAGLISVTVTNPRHFTEDKHRIVDDYPFGGGEGMVMKPEPIFKAVEKVKNSNKRSHTLLMSPGGRTFDQQMAKKLSKYEQLILICGHYEGIDHRVETLVDEAVSIGDYVLTGGELPAMVIIDTVARMIPGVLGAHEGALHDSFYNGLLEYPQYTRPREYRGLAVPDILLSGDHAKITRWRRKESLKKTYLLRKDLLKTVKLQPGDGNLLAEILNEQAGDD